MKVIVDWDLCVGHGQCEYAAPDVFQINEDGGLEVLDYEPGESQRSAVQEAIRICPARALSLES